MITDYVFLCKPLLKFSKGCSGSYCIRGRALVPQITSASKRQSCGWDSGPRACAQGQKEGICSSQTGVGQENQQREWLRHAKDGERKYEIIKDKRPKDKTKMLKDPWVRKMAFRLGFWWLVKMFGLGFTRLLFSQIRTTNLPWLVLAWVEGTFQRQQHWQEHWQGMMLWRPQQHELDSYILWPVVTLSSYIQISCHYITFKSLQPHDVNLKSI